MFLNVLKFILPFSAVLLLNSCARILNTDEQSIIITQHNQLTKVRIDSLNLAYNDDGDLYVKRSKQPLIIYCEYKGVTQSVSVAAGYSKAYYLNFNPCAGYGLGFIFDKPSNRKYAYPSQIYLDVKDSTIVWKRFKPIKKGSVFFDLSIPYINFFQTSTTNSYYSTAGFMGIQAGVEIYYKTDKFISLTTGSALDFTIPVPAPVHYGVPRQSTGINYLCARNHLIIKTVEFGYGLNYSKSHWSKTDVWYDYYQKINYSAGLSFSVFWRRRNSFRPGIIYNPGLIILNPKPVFDYNYFASIVFSWKIPVWRSK